MRSKNRRQFGGGERLSRTRGDGLDFGEMVLKRTFNERTWTESKKTMEGVGMMEGNWEMVPGFMSAMVGIRAHLEIYAMTRQDVLTGPNLA